MLWGVTVIILHLLYGSLMHRQIHQLPKAGDCYKPTRNHGEYQVVVPAMGDRRPWCG